MIAVTPHLNRLEDSAAGDRRPMSIGWRSLRPTIAGPSSPVLVRVQRDPLFQLRTAVNKATHAGRRRTMPNPVTGTLSHLP